MIYYVIENSINIWLIPYWISVQNVLSHFLSMQIESMLHVFMMAINKHVDF